MKIIEQIKQQDLDPNGNSDNFWVLVDKINEIAGQLNGRITFRVREEKLHEIKELLRPVLKEGSNHSPYIDNIIERIVRALVEK